jgi:hypothetical protein
MQIGCESFYCTRTHVDFFCFLYQLLWREALIFKFHVIVVDGSAIVMKSIFFYIRNSEAAFGLELLVFLGGSSFVSSPTWGFKG